MIGDENADAAFLEVSDEMTDIPDRNRVNPGKRFVEQQVAWIGGKAACDFNPAPLATGKGKGRCAAQMFNRKLREELFEAFAPFVSVFLGNIEDRHNVFLDGQAAKNRHFLWQVANPELGAAIHWQMRYVAPVDGHASAFRHD